MLSWPGLLFLRWQGLSGSGNGLLRRRTVAQEVSKTLFAAAAQTSEADGPGILTSRLPRCRNLLELCWRPVRPPARGVARRGRGQLGLWGWGQLGPWREGQLGLWGWEGQLGLWGWGQMGPWWEGQLGLWGEDLIGLWG